MIHLDDDKSIFEISGPMEDILYEYSEIGLAIVDVMRDNGTTQRELHDMFYSMVDVMLMTDEEFEEYAAITQKKRKEMLS